MSVHNRPPVGLRPRPTRMAASDGIQAAPSAIYLKNIGRSPASQRVLSRLEAKQCITDALGELALEGTKCPRRALAKPNSSAPMGMTSQQGAAPPRPSTPAPEPAVAPAGPMPEMRPEFKQLKTLCDDIVATQPKKADPTKQQEIRDSWLRAGRLHRDDEQDKTFQKANKLMRSGKTLKPQELIFVARFVSSVMSSEINQRYFFPPSRLDGG